MDIEEMKDKLRPMNLKEVARETGLHYNTVSLFVNRGTKERGYQYETVKKLHEYLSK